MLKLIMLLLQNQNYFLPLAGNIITVSYIAFSFPVGRSDYGTE